MAKKNAKVIKYRKPWNLNVGVVIFAFIFIYMVASVWVYVTKEKVHIYEVAEGSLTSSAYMDYAALILRDETVTTSDSAGYINYYIRDGRKIGKGDLIYTIDETGRMLEMFDQHTGVSSLPSEDLQEFKTEAAQFSLSYDPMNFADVYDMKSSMQSTLLEYMNANALEELASQLTKEETSNFVKVYAAQSGVISAVLDGMEGLTPEQVTAEHFDSSKHPKKILSSGQGVEVGTPVYRTVQSEEWYLVFPLAEEEISRFKNVEQVTLTIKGASVEMNGGFSMYVGADGGTYGKITISRYLVQFVNKRYVNIQIKTNSPVGLKIPQTSVIYKSFYKVPMAYLNEENELLIETYAEDGTVTVNKEKPVLLTQDEEYCYLSASGYRAGINVVKENSNDRFQLAQTVQLPGVYNVNKGYAVFKKIHILEESEEYLIVSSSESSLSIYDHIVLNGELVDEGEIIYY